VFRGAPAPGAVRGSLNPVRDQQRAMRAAQPPQVGLVIVRRNNDAAVALDRFGDHGRDDATSKELFHNNELCVVDHQGGFRPAAQQREDGGRKAHEGAAVMDGARRHNQPPFELSLGRVLKEQDAPASLGRRDVPLRAAVRNAEAVWAGRTGASLVVIAKKMPFACRSPFATNPSRSSVSGLRDSLALHAGLRASR
jgi:hypothetical protein